MLTILPRLKTTLPHRISYLCIFNTNVETDFKIMYSMTMTKSNQTVITQLSFTSSWDYNFCSHSLLTLSLSSMGSNVARSNLIQLKFPKIQIHTRFI
jgi:hypothetical protein